METKKMRSSHVPETFDFSKLPDDETTEHVNLSFWVPLSIKKKYEKAQSKTKKQYGKFLKGIVIKQINAAKVES